MRKTPPPTKRGSIFGDWLFWMAIGLFGVWVASPWLVALAAGDADGAAGQFGDRYGAVNAFFTGAALIGVLYSLRAQQSEWARARLQHEQNMAAEHVEKRIQVLEKYIFELATHLNGQRNDALLRAREGINFTVASYAQLKFVRDRGGQSVQENPDLVSLMKFRQELEGLLEKRLSDSQ